MVRASCWGGEPTTSAESLEVGFFTIEQALELVTWPNENVIHESKSILKIRGKGNKERELTLTPKLIQAIDRYKPIRRAILEERNTKDEFALFVNEKHGKRLTRRGIEHIIEQIAKAASVECDFNVSPYKLRHTCATILYNEGNADLLAIAELLGHKTQALARSIQRLNRKKCVL